jgi:transposase/DNA replication protein DnaC
VITLGEVVMILDLHRQGLSVSAIAERVGVDRKTVRKYIDRGLEPPVYGPRQPRPRRIDPFIPYLRERVAAWPDLSGRRLLRELRERGYQGGYTALTDVLRGLRPPAAPAFEVRFETPPGDQAQVDFAQFQVVFDDEPGVVRIVWLFSLVLGHSRFLWARFVLHQDLQTVLRCHLAAFAALGGVPRQILYDRMKTAVTGEDAEGHIVYNRTLVDVARHHGYHPRACRPYRAKTKGKVERPYRYIREDFFLARSFQNLDDLNAQLAGWLDTVANPRVHATTGRVVDEAFAEEKPHLQPLPPVPFRSVLRLERRVSHDGMVSVGGSFYSVPDTTRRRVLEVHALADEIQIFETGQLIARHPVLEGRNQRSMLPRRRGRRAPLARLLRRRRPSSRRNGADGMTARTEPSGSLLDRIKQTLVGLRMPRALEMIDITVQQLERGELSPLEAIEGLLAEELSIRESRRVKAALVMARLSTIKTLAGFDFAFQPSLDRNRVLALAQLDFIDRHEVVHLLGPPGTGKSHLAVALGVEAVKAGRSVYFVTLADVVAALAQAEREGRLRDKIRFFCRASLLIVDEIGYLPVVPDGGSLFFQLVNARYEKGAMILTSNRGFAEWGEIFGDPVVATALLDRLLHHAVVIQIEGSSYRLRQHAELVPEHIRSKALITPPLPAPSPRRRGRPPKSRDPAPV